MTKIDSNKNIDSAKQKNNDKNCEKIMKNKKIIFLKNDNSEIRVL